MELEYKDPYEIWWIVSYGDDIEEGQVLGYYCEEVISTMEGIISNINTSEVLVPIKQFVDLLTLTDGTKEELFGSPGPRIRAEPPLFILSRTGKAIPAETR